MVYLYSKLTRLLQPKHLPRPGSAAILILRLIAGVAFMFHGWNKITNPFGWMGTQVPGIFQFLAALSEFGGGLAWVLGLLMPLASVGIFCTMTVAVYMHLVLAGDPFVSMTGEGGSYEPALIFWGIAIVFFALGPGKFSLDRKIFGQAGT